MNASMHHQARTQQCTSTGAGTKGIRGESHEDVKGEGGVEKHRFVLLFMGF
jgi:hypothetical protein